MQRMAAASVGFVKLFVVGTDYLSALWSPKSALGKKFLVMCLLGAVLVGYRLWVPVGLAGYLIRYTGYWAILLLVACGLWAVGRFFSGADRDWRAFFRRHRVGWLLALVGAGFWQVHEPHQMRVLYDEHLSAGLAHTMHLQREAAYPIRAHYINGDFSILNYETDRRGLLFPFVVASMHDVTGFRVSNAFVVNGIVGLFSLLLIYHLVLELAPARVAWAAVGLWAGLPLLIQGATGGGYDLLNVTLAELWLLLALRFIKSEGGDFLNLFVLSACLLAQVRNESMLFLAGTGLIVLVKWLGEKRAGISWMSALAPIFMFIPLSVNAFFNSELTPKETLPGQDFFSFSYLSENLPHAIVFLFNPDLEGVNSFLLSLLGTGALLLFVVRCLKWRMTRPPTKNDIVLLVFLGVVAGIFLMFMSTFWGNWMDPVVSRFSLTLQLALIVFVARIAGEELRTRSLPLWVFPLLFIYVISVEVPASSTMIATRNCIPAKEFRFLEKQLATREQGQLAVLAQNCTMPILLGHGAFPIEMANFAPWKVQALLDQGVYKELWMANRYELDFKTQEWRQSGVSKLSDDFDLEFIGETRTGFSSSFRIYRVRGLRDKQPAVEKFKEVFAAPPTDWMDYYRRLIDSLP